MWRAKCSFSDTPTGLKKKSRYCRLCRLLFGGISGHEAGDDRIVQFFRIGSSLACSDRPEQPIASLYTLPGSEILSSGIQAGLPKLLDPGSTQHIKVLATWIRSCDQTYECLPRYDTFLPTRVLDVGNANSNTIRLTCHSRDHTNSGNYLALSHRWGSPVQHRKFCTFTTNIKELMKSIDVAELPRTFRHAVQVTRSLGVQYLWIDSLCIIQDDPEDWDNESKLMEQVFSSAYATIAATCASGTDDGFLKRRPERQCVTMMKDTRSIYFVCDAIDNFHEDVDQGELNRRGWVLQERALSRRTIHFTEKQCYWECGRGVRCETLTKMKNRKASFLGDANFPHSVETYVKGMKIELFQDLYTRYSTLALSFNADRPIAIRGLERRLIRTLNTVGGYGIFDIYMHRCLLWQRSGSSLTRIPSFRGESVPSWSWMAYDGGIKYMDIPFGKVSWADDVISPFKGEGFEDTGNRRDEALRTEMEAPVWDFIDSQGGQLVLDEPGRDVAGPLKCVIMGTIKQPLIDQEQLNYVLVIALNEEEVYERVGVGVLERSQIILDKLRKFVRIR